MAWTLQRIDSTGEKIIVSYNRGLYDDICPKILFSKKDGFVNGVRPYIFLEKEKALLNRAYFNQSFFNQSLIWKGTNNNPFELVEYKKGDFPVLIKDWSITEKFTNLFANKGVLQHPEKCKEVVLSTIKHFSDFWQLKCDESEVGLFLESINEVAEDINSNPYGITEKWSCLSKMEKECFLSITETLLEDKSNNCTSVCQSEKLEKESIKMYAFMIEQLKVC